MYVVSCGTDDEERAERAADGAPQRGGREAAAARDTEDLQLRAAAAQAVCRYVRMRCYISNSMYTVGR